MQIKEENYEIPNLFTQADDVQINDNEYMTDEEGEEEDELEDVADLDNGPAIRTPQKYFSFT